MASLDLPTRGSRWRSIVAILLLAFTLRVAGALVAGHGSPGVAQGYQYYLEMADNVAEGRGFFRTMPFGQGEPRAIRTPGYVLVLGALRALPIQRGIAIALFGICCGTLTVLFGTLLALRALGTRAGFAAGLVLACWPMAVVHDSALQDTALYTMLFIALAGLAHRLTEEARRGDVWRAVVLGLVAAAAVLVRVALLPTAIILCAWVLLSARPAKQRLLLALVASVALQAGLAPWRVRNARVIGSPVLTSDSGRSLWLGNNPQTFSVYPQQSIDRAEERAWTALPEETRAHVRQAPSELGRDAWFRDEALRFIWAEPVAALGGAARKAWVTFSPWYSPEGSLLKQGLHLVSYGPVAVLALLAGWRRRRERLTWMVFTCAGVLALQSAVYFGHSGYRAYIDPLLIVLAASCFVPRGDASERTT